MTLSAGTRLGPYEILSPLGAGGMGEVYKAKDTRLDRLVAVKVLPSHLSETPDAKARFEREARAISQLTHPHICTLHDVGSEGGVEYLVMELLEGQTLADRLEKGPLATEQVLRYGIEIADALDKAHRAGIVHRDLKPGNVMLTKSGVKLLDFGLAKAMSASTEVDGLSSLPTESERPLTERGTILGTFQYMAPEQLEGKDADARSDIFAFGCVLYEMATGKKAFTGGTRVSLISSILRDDPRPISTVAPMTPPALDRVVKTCLAKDPEERWQSAHDVKSELQWIAEAGSQAGAPAVVVSKRRSRERLAWGLAAVALVAAAAGWLLRPSAPRGEPMRLGLPKPRGVSFLAYLTPSPDGTRIAFIGQAASGKHLLFVRPIGSLEARELPGTEGASLPFWSPDGRKIAYFADGKLWKIDASGGPAETLCEAPGPWGASWSPSGTIVLAPSPTDGLFTVSADGGKPARLTTLAPGEEAHRWPVFLPDGKHVVFLIDAYRTEDHWMAVTSLGAKKITRIANIISNFSVVPPDRVLYVKSGSLVARQFDTGKLRFIGEPEPVGESILQLGPNHLFDFGSAANIVTYQTVDPNLPFAWFDRSGKKISTIGEPGRYQRIEISPDGSHAAFEKLNLDGRNENIWSIDLVRGIAARLTTGPSSDYGPVWSRDGRTLWFSSTRDGMDHIYEVPVSRVADVREIKALKEATLDVWSSSPDGHLVYEAQQRDGKPDLWTLSPGSKRDAAPFRATSAGETEAQFSPDGKWVAFSSDDTGRQEVYVRSFADPSTEVQVSTDGGFRPRWRRDGRELFFWNKSATLTAVPVSTDSQFHAGAPVPLFSLPVWVDYDVAADGQRFLILTTAENAEPAGVAVVNWMEGLRKP